MNDTTPEIKKLRGVHPTLVEKVKRILFAMAELGHPMLVTDGARTVEQQQALFEKGRTTKGEPPYTADRPLGRTVTKCDGVTKKSNHQVKDDGFGYAVDCCFLVDGKANWDEDRPWRLYGEMGKALGLKWGGHFPAVDSPHLEMPE